MASRLIVSFSAGPSVVQWPSTVGSRPSHPGAVFGKLRIPTDPIGTFALTLTNLVVGSNLQIEDQAGTTTMFNGTAATSSQLINLQAYAGGSALNNLRIKVRKGSAAPYYLPWETITTAVVGSQSIYVAQVADE